MLLTLIDSHCHLDLASFDRDRTKMLQRGRDANISHFIVPAIDAAHWSNLTKITEKYSCLYPAYGLHPVFMEQHQATDIAQLAVYLATNKAIAVGECGLDFFIPEAQSERAKQAQLSLFIQQLELAQQYQLPVIIHARKSLDFILKEIRKRPDLRGVVHSFSGSEQQANQLIERGFYLGFGGVITYTRAKKLRHLVSCLPLEALLLESDAPDQPDALHYGQRNEPAWLKEIANTMAMLRQCSLQHLIETTTQNAFTLFNFPSDTKPMI
ncbi:MAG: TatD family hydrolase [Cocleimonas sp.]|nr:TatD family hydrolase [Cocleimonas sp.]